MSTYGTISEEADQLEASSSNRQFLLRTQELIQTCVGTIRPWKHIIKPSHLTLPFSFSHAIQRIKINAPVLRANYAITILFVIFLSLLWHPMSVIILGIVVASWVVLYFMRDDTMRVFGYEIDERLVFTLMLLFTVGFFFLSSVTDNIVVGSCVGVMIVLIHGAMTESHENYLGGEGAASTASIAEVEEEIANGGRDVVKVPLRETASSSFTMS